jgi:predicted GNAT family acetyltransferase
MDTGEDPAMDVNEITATDQEERHRFVVRDDGVEAELVYRAENGRLVLLHTEVPAEFRGQGIAGRLVAAAADRARNRGEVVVPRCPYARKWLGEHAEAVDGVTVDWED